MSLFVKVFMWKCSILRGSVIDDFCFYYDHKQLTLFKVTCYILFEFPFGHFILPQLYIRVSVSVLEVVPSSQFLKIYKSKSLAGTDGTIIAFKKTSFHTLDVLCDCQCDPTLNNH